jgi:hypothetical protein
MKDKIDLKNFNLGGIADSDYMGGKNSMAELWGFDIHSESGVSKVNQALTKDSGNTIDDLVLAGISCSDSNVYLFGSTTGKIWKRNSSGVYSLEATVSPSSGSAGIVGAIEYMGYIYYAMEKKLGRVAVGSSWSSRDDNWETFAGGDSLYHPMLILNLVLYIGDKNYVAQVDDGVFSNQALDMPDLSSSLRVRCLGQLGTDLLIGGYVSSDVIGTEIYRWNTWSVSFTNSDPIPEVGINAFIPIDNGVIVNAGTKGNLYVYDGVSLDLYKQIKGDYSGGKKAFVNNNAVLNFAGLPLFGLSNLNGNPTTLGIYSLGRTNRNYPIILNGEVGISTGHLSNIEIGCIIGYGSKYLVSWKDSTNPNNIVYGVDILNLTAKYPGAFMTSRVVMVDRFTLLNFTLAQIAYKSLPEDTSFTILKKVNHDSWKDIDLSNCINDKQRQVFLTNVDLNDATTMQIKVKANVKGNDAPEIEAIRLSVNI